MHFFYLDESGDTGMNLNDPNQPIFVLGGISVRDKGWNKTQELFTSKIENFFQRELSGFKVPRDFELHADELLSPKGEGVFSNIELEKRCQLVLELLNILHERSHSAHYLAIDKQKLKNAPLLNMELPYDSKCPYLLAFDFMINYINWFVKEKLGQSARAMIILDRKENYHEDIERIMRVRRYSGPKIYRLKRIVEFSYPIDSKKNPMIQFSDLVIYCVRKFIELEHGYRDNWPEEAKNFYAKCYSIIHDRVAKLTMVPRQEKGMEQLNAFFNNVKIGPRKKWRQNYII